MIQRNEMLSVLLDDSRSETARLNAIADLKDCLDDESVIMRLLDITLAEPSIKVRAALLALIVEVPITKITQRVEYVDVLFHYAIMEKERALRHTAVQRLVSLAPGNQDTELLLSEILVNDPDKEIRGICVQALSETQCRNPFVVNNIADYSMTIDSDYTESFFCVLRKLDDSTFEQILLSLYSPYNPAAVRHEVLNEFARKTALSEQVYHKLLSCLFKETDEVLIDHLVKVFMTKTIQDESVIDYLIKEIETNPYNPGFVELIRGLVASNPQVVSRLVTLFGQACSSQLKLHLLTVLEHAVDMDILVKAVHDKHCEVRSLALTLLRNQFDQAPERAARALIALLHQDVPFFVVEQVIETLSMVRVLSKENEQAFLAFFNSVNNPALLEKLSYLVMRIPVGANNSDTLLTAYLRMLDNNIYSKELKNLILDQLIHFNTADNNGVKTCLEALMRKETTLENLEAIYLKYKEFRDNSNAEISLLLKLFLRFAHCHPTSLTDMWLAEFKQYMNSNEEVKQISGYLIWMTQDQSMILAKGTKELDGHLIGSIKEAVVGGYLEKARTLLNDAYDNQAIKKSEISHLLEWVLKGHVCRHAFLDSIIRLLKEARLFSGTIKESAVRFLQDYPRDITCDILMGLLKSASEKDVRFRQTIAALLDQEHYAQIINRNLTGRHGYAYGATPYAGHWWGKPHHWPLFDLIEGEEDELIFYKRILTTPVEKGVRENHAIHYFVLNRLIRKPVDFEFLEILASFIDQLDVDLTIGSMFDRACCVFHAAYSDIFEYQRTQAPPSHDLVKKQTEILVYHYLQYLDYAHRTEQFVRLPVKVDWIYLEQTLNLWKVSFGEFLSPIAEYVKQENTLKASKPDVSHNCPVMLNVQELSDESIEQFILNAYRLPEKDEKLESIVRILDWKYDWELKIHTLDEDVQSVIKSYLG